MRNCEQPVAYYKTYKHQTPDEERVCDGDRQIEDLKAKVLKNFPNVEFINLCMKEIIEAAYMSGFEPSSEDLTETALYEEAKAYLEKSIQY